MRTKSSKGGLTVHAVAGSHVVLLGLDLTAAARPGCLGFAIQREDRTEDEKYWMSGMKVFQATDPHAGAGAQVSSRQHPFQSFQWSDYSAKPDHEYTYRVVALHGKPDDLEEHITVSVDVTTEGESGKKHSIFFNRGAVASQEYARRFQNKAPDETDDPEAARRWLSRGLLEAFRAFIGRANGPSFGLRGAIYELQWPGALEALRGAHQAKASVKIIYDAIPKKTGPKKKNEDAIAKAQAKTITDGRTIGTIMHNKFVVLTKKDKPIAVWLGSTNMTENGIFGHLNCGHVIEDAGVAAAYLAYYDEIAKDPTAKDERTWMAATNPAPPVPWKDDQVEIFSPRQGLEVLEWYAKVAGDAQDALFMTFAFGMHATFKAVYEKKDDVLRMALMEKEGNGAQLEQGRKDIQRIRKLPNVVIAVAKSIKKEAFDSWLAEREKLTPTANVKYVHTKFMLIDPLGKSPVVITGSANFSEASTNKNEENMVVIRGDRRVADIYLGEFMRAYSHYAFREAVSIAQRTHEKWSPKYLEPTDAWQKAYFGPTGEKNGKALRRRYFAGT